MSTHAQWLILIWLTGLLVLGLAVRIVRDYWRSDWRAERKRRKRKYPLLSRN